MPTKTKKPTAPACPECGAMAIPILYGEPPEESFRAAKRGELALGGCCIETGENGRATNPGWRCKACRHEFGRVEGFDSKPTART